MKLFILFFTALNAVPMDISFRWELDCGIAWAPEALQCDGLGEKEETECAVATLKELYNCFTNCMNNHI